MRASPKLQRMCARAGYILPLVLLALRHHVTAFPVEPYAETLDTDLWDPECTAAQRRYIEKELTEAQTMANTAVSRLTELRDVLVDKRQPRDWGTRSKSVTEALMTWNSFFGIVRLNDRNPPSGSFVTIRQAIEDIKYTRNNYIRIKKALVAKDDFKMRINCQDDFLINPEVKEDQDNEGNTVRFREFQDSRSEGSRGTITAPLANSLCFEKATLSGWTFYNDVTEVQEMMLCPRALERWGTTTLTSTPETKASLLGQRLIGLKSKAGATIILHELTHSRALHGGFKTVDRSYSYEGTTRMAYGTLGIRALARQNLRVTRTNADTLALFALAMYYDQRVWDTGTCTDQDKSQTFARITFDYDY
ncbi:hypothetical protein BJY04DRAFT_221950 [Aspergillus karnatakaensis]|uniref:uncharacterized protein n=1 Tax=Aspergillus karnatakaensis TaxID=1810916 RepID=UPI003CCD8C36